MTSPLFDYLWPCLMIGVIVGAIGGTLAMRRGLVGSRRKLAFGVTGLAAILGAMMWSGPFGAANRFIAAVEPPIQAMLVHYEMTQVKASLRRSPLRRQIIYSGPADDVQRTELVRMAEELPGVASATWNLKVRAIPIVVEAGAVTLFGLLLGLFMAYSFDARRRANADWSW